ncbi:MAG: Phosphoglycerate kinase [Alphaproteobacteria bacterium MarineAlpha5_Bin5]|nr:MAG: Phosphoglycerate kinase [Alphaproteobacteria bacterium MarineAlpha5_Bin5]PPR52522.1 MAG: Phosphoglycerate kinase [Alphaproteobacteria bacterium MarineAlpha5_Bin4]|tara:strand:- start:63 stop:1259 length:1197 start_codon:yes stop_codon:yes gene_type:complete
MKNLENFSINYKKVLFRADLNVPVIDGKISDFSRILAVNQSIQKLLNQNNKIFIITHFGRPKGEVNKKYSIKFLIPFLEEIYRVKKIFFLENLNSKSIIKKLDELNFGDICLVENIRFYPEEEKLDLNFAKKISNHFDVFVNDAFSASHRNHTSISGITKFLPGVAGDHLLKEIHNIDIFLKNVKKPNIAIIGGSKVSTKIKLLNNLIELFSTIVIGGAMANTFLLSNNYQLGNSLVEKELTNIAKDIQSKANKFNCKLILPIDVMCSNNVSDKINIRTCNVNKVLKNHMILDLGEKTTNFICNEILKSKMLLWNGPLGAFEHKPFDISTMKIAHTINKYSKSLNIDALAGGGDTVSAITSANAEEGFKYISNAGGAFLEWLEGNESPGIKALKDKKI